MLDPSSRLVRSMEKSASEQCTSQSSVDRRPRIIEVKSGRRTLDAAFLTDAIYNNIKANFGHDFEDDEPVGNVVARKFLPQI